MEFFEKDTLTALQAKEKAQWIAFAPVVFQTSRILRDSGILENIERSTDGLSFEEVSQKVDLPAYGIRVLMEAALGIGLLILKGERYYTTKTTSFILHDTLTQVNMNFVHDVCYQGMYHLEDSIKSGKPQGLKVFGEWPSIYEGLSKLPVPVQNSWFGFDHFYSDYAFPDVLTYVFESQPKTLLDIGGNTGRWALECFQFDPAIEVTIMDLPGQVQMAKAKIEEKGYLDRVRFFPCDMLDAEQVFPAGFDVIWMSQFLDCFSEVQIQSILKRCHAALSPEGSVYILEPFWDKQRFEVSAFALQQTSLYFTAMANGNSQMYHSANFIRCIESAGFHVVEHKAPVGVSHSLLKCKPRENFIPLSGLGNDETSVPIMNITE